jgi:carbamoyltransferase
MPSSAQQPIYVLGTGLSHNGSAVLLRDGKICVAIEKERITRRKHDGGNDTEAILYCLETEGITLEDVSLVVQCANFEIPDRKRFHGPRLFAETAHPPLISISHHLAHAWSAAGTCPFDECAVMVIDGCGSPLAQCIDAENIPEGLPAGEMLCEKDSFYRFDGKKMRPLFKDFSPMSGDRESAVGMQTTRDSIGGFYAAVSRYVFGNMDDVGKLMGLAPFGNKGFSGKDVFRFENSRLFVAEEWKSDLDRPAADYAAFQADFQYYADVAHWAQEQVEKAVSELFRLRSEEFPSEKIAYSGGVALNAVANARLLNEGVVRELYIEPAAGDNGLALGCAFYGWIAFLGREKVKHDGNTCFGRSYGQSGIRTALEAFGDRLTFSEMAEADLLDRTAENLAAGKIVGWFREGAEFGPRALGRRSILAHPGIAGLGDRINAEVKLREDFRPFAPAVLPELAGLYFESGRKSPYMILVDRTREEFRTNLANVTHRNGTARVQTVEKAWNARFFGLIEAFSEKTGIGALLNTSFNRKGMPIVETPAEAISLFLESAIDVLVLDDFFVLKR